MLSVAEDRGANVAENDMPVVLWHGQLSAGIDDSAAVYLLPRARVCKLLLLKSIEDGVADDAEHDVFKLDIGVDDLTLGMQEVQGEEDALQYV